MNKSGMASLPLHGGATPRWLFKRMVSLARGIIDIIILEYQPFELIKRLSDPFWFQAFSCTLGFDWHSSGTTTVTCGVLKEVVCPELHGIGIAGGKGKSARNTLKEIVDHGETLGLVSSKIDTLKYSSRMVAKVDSAALQDGHQLYHHNIIFTEDGKWIVIQQGMNIDNKRARRYHWLSETIQDFVEEPHETILGQESKVLDMTSKKSTETKKVTLDLVNDHPRHMKNDWKRINIPHGQSTLLNFKNFYNIPKFIKMPKTINWRLMKEVYDFQPKNYEEFLSLKGVGPSTVRALALISNLIYGCPPSWKDPVKYTFTVGGKDGVPYPVDTKAMDKSISIIENGVKQAKMGKKEKLRSLWRLQQCIPPEIR
jgi:hypothetical protein